MTDGETASFVSPRPSMFAEASIEDEGNKTHCFLRGQSLSVMLYFTTQKYKKTQPKRNNLLDSIAYTGCARKIERLLAKPTCPIAKSR